MLKARAYVHKDCAFLLKDRTIMFNDRAFALKDRAYVLRAHAYVLKDRAFVLKGFKGVGAGKYDGSVCVCKPVTLAMQGRPGWFTLLKKSEC